MTFVFVFSELRHQGGRAAAAWDESRGHLARQLGVQGHVQGRQHRLVLRRKSAVVLPSKCRSGQIESDPIERSPPPPSKTSGLPVISRHNASCGTKKKRKKKREVKRKRRKKNKRKKKETKNTGKDLKCIVAPLFSQDL